MGATRALLVDIDGVLVVSWRPIDGAVTALQELRRAGTPLRFVTNTTSRTRDDIAQALVGAGFEVEPDEIITATASTASYLRAHHAGARCLLLNEGDVSSDLDGVTLVDGPPADVVVLGGAGPAFTYDALNQAFSLVVDGAELVAMHRNLAWQTTDGLSLDTGAFIAGFEAAAGVETVVVGKPSADFFRAGVEELGADPHEVAMVGDDVLSDVLGAQAAGITGVLVRTGKFREESLVDLDSAPDHVVDSFADVPEWLGLDD